MYNREAATDCGMRHAGVARVEASNLGCGGGGAVRADGGTGGSGRSMGCVKAAERLGRIGAMWLGAERACVWVARRRDGLAAPSDVRSGRWLRGVLCGIADGVCGDAGCGVVVWGAGVR